MEAPTPPSNSGEQASSPPDIDFAAMLAPFDAAQNELRANGNLSSAPAEPTPEATLAPEVVPAPMPEPEATPAPAPLLNAPMLPVPRPRPRPRPRPTTPPAASPTGLPNLAGFPSAVTPVALPAPAPRPAPVSTPEVTPAPALSTPEANPAIVPVTPEPTPAPAPAPAPEVVPTLPAATPEATTPEKTGARIVGSAFIMESNRLSAAKAGAQKEWDDNHAPNMGTLKGLTEAEYIKQVQIPRAVTTITDHGAVLIEGNDDPQAGAIVAAVGRAYVAPVNADRRKMESAFSTARRTAQPVAESTRADASLLAINIEGNQFSVGIAGNTCLFAGQLGNPAKLGVGPIASQVRQQGRFERPENSLFMTDREKSLHLPSDLQHDGYVAKKLTVPTRFVGASSALELAKLRDEYPAEFAEAFHKPDPNEAAEALKELAASKYDSLIHQADKALFIIDVEPGAEPAPKPAPTPAPSAPVTPPTPPAPPMPTTPPAPVAAPVPAPPAAAPAPANRVLDNISHQARVLLSDLARKEGGDINDEQFIGDHDLQMAVDRVYADAFDDYVTMLAKRSDASLFFDGKGHSAASYNFAGALEARQTLGGLMLEKRLKETTLLNEDDRDEQIREQIIKGMLGGDVTSIPDPLIPPVTITIEGTIAELGNAVHNKRLENMGWAEDYVTGEMIPPQDGLRKYTTKFVEKWAEWGAQGGRGRVKRMATMATGGLAVAAVTALTAGVAGVAVGSGASLLTAGGAAVATTRVSRALVGTRLNKQSTTLTQARENRTDLVERVKLNYRIDETNETVTSGFNWNAEASKRRNSRRAIIGGIATLASGVGGELTHYLLDHAGDWFDGIGNSIADHTPTQGSHPGSAPSSHPSATPTSRPSADPSSRPSASASPRTPSPSSSSSAGTPSTSASTHPSPSSSATTPTSRPTTGSGNQPGTGNTTPGHGTGNGAETTPGGNSPNAVELKIGNNQTVSDVISNAKSGHFSENWQTMLDSAKSAQAAGQLRTIQLQNGNFYYQSMVNGHWTDNTTAVVKTLSKFSKGKFALAA